MIHALYFIVGWLVAWRVQRYSRNALLLVLLWPIPIAAHLVYLVTGKYPWWHPPI